MLAAIRSAAVLGVDAFEVTVEVHVANGLPQVTVVGLAAGAVKESRERVTAALANAGFPIPPRRITINLAPADVRKDGTAYDLPIAIGLLVAVGVVPEASVASLAVVGELALDGTVRAIRGALPIARWAARAGHTLVLPPANLPEASCITDAPLAVPRTVGELVADLSAGRLRPTRGRRPPAAAPCADDFADVIGQDAAKRALEIAAAGGHHVALVGPPGAGKTMLARRLPSILPTLAESEALEVLAVRSVAGLATADPTWPARPFRAPHHTISAPGLVGGGSVPRPGEVSLAHRGVLFLDELLEFPRHVLDALRQPMEDGHVLVTRAAAAVTLPARFTLVGAMNPCPCGHAGEPDRSCRCTGADVDRYTSRLSGPLADRIDMHIRVGAVSPRAIGAAPAYGEPSGAIRARVEAARERQRIRYAALPGPRPECNADASGRWVDRHGLVDPAARDLLVAAGERLALSARAFYRVLRIARTIADLADSPPVTAMHVAEALRYRPPGAAAPPRDARAGGAAGSGGSARAGHGGDRSPPRALPSPHVDPAAAG